MEELSKELLNFEKCLEYYCPFLYKILQNPASSIMISQVKDEQLISLYKWKNGIVNDGTLPTVTFDFCGFGVVPSLEYVNEVLSIKKITKFWRQSYFPVITSFAGDYLLYESDKNSKHYGSIYLYSPNLGYVYDLVSIYDSLFLMFKTTRICFEEKAIVYNNLEKRLETNYESCMSISSLLNPLSEYWK